MKGAGRERDAVRVRHVHCESKFSLVVVPISFRVGFVVALDESSTNRYRRIFSLALSTLFIGCFTDRGALSTSPLVQEQPADESSNPFSMFKDGLSRRGRRCI